MRRWGHRPLRRFLRLHSAARPTVAAAGNESASVRWWQRLLDPLVAISCYRDLERLDRAGTLAPLRRALLNPIAIACLRFFTGCLPERMWCISVRTSFCALRPYFRPREEERLDLAVERCDRELRRLELRLFAIVTSPHQTQSPGNGLAQET